MARKTTNAKIKRKQKSNTQKKGLAAGDGFDLATGDGFDSSAQESEYLNLRKRVDVRKDAKQILKIAKRIQEESDT